MTIPLAAVLLATFVHAGPPKAPADPTKELDKAVKSAEAALRQLEKTQKTVDALLDALGAPKEDASKSLVREAAPNFVVIPEGKNELLMLKPDAARIALIEKANRGKPAARKIKYRVLIGGADPARNKVVVVDFWGAWCHPCMEALPALSAIQTEYRARGVEVVGIAIGTEAEDLAKAAKASSYVLAHDNVAEPAQEAYAVKEFPTLVVIDRKGRVVTRHSGWGDHSGKELRELLDRVLAETP